VNSKGAWEGGREHGGVRTVLMVGRKQREWACEGAVGKEGYERDIRAIVWYRGSNLDWNVKRDSVSKG
jgi:hypothetical protein